MVAVEEAQGALDADGYGLPGLFGVVAQPPGSPAATDGTGEFRDKRVSFAPGARSPLWVVVGVGLGDVVIKVTQPGPVGGQRLPIEGGSPRDRVIVPARSLADTGWPGWASSAAMSCIPLAWGT